MATYTHSQLQNGHGPAGKELVARVAAPVIGVGRGAVTSLTPTTLPDIADIVQVTNGGEVLSELYISKNDSAKLNQAQTIAKAYDGRGLVLKVWSEGGKTGAYTLAYS